ncbi:sulfotransferase family 2 domain-containing protein [Dyella sp. S184]|uniref:sulfotransferase family 2 domain-containing protein n=1 Tax=Dyella sp. S184 TaxID=1641862 RepID=UPI00131C72C8|nr:sulfotransferase family 2 domain-containing protein [Dyella sp. S184]
MPLISLHLPKTGGTSFKASLMEHFGDRYRNDYSDQALSHSRLDRFRAALSAGEVIADQGLDNIECVHGHFMPVKYQRLDTKGALTFVTWMREPVARMLSHYDYWRANYDEKNATPNHRKFIEEGWTLEQFCLSEQFRNIYTQYLWGFPLERFAFVGITEYYREDMLEFSERFLSTSLQPRYLNAMKYGISRRIVDDVFLEKVRDFHAADMQLYQRALRWRQARFRSNQEKKQKVLVRMAMDLAKIAHRQMLNKE